MTADITYDQVQGLRRLVQRSYDEYDEYDEYDRQREARREEHPFREHQEDTSDMQNLLLDIEYAQKALAFCEDSYRASLTPTRWVVTYHDSQASKEVRYCTKSVILDSVADFLLRPGAGRTEFILSYIEVSKEVAMAHCLRKNLPYHEY